MRIRQKTVIEQMDEAERVTHSFFQTHIANISLRRQMRSWSLYYRLMVQCDDREEAVYALRQAVRCRELDKRTNERLLQRMGPQNRSMVARANQGGADTTRRS